MVAAPDLGSGVNSCEFDSHYSYCEQKSLEVFIRNGACTKSEFELANGYYVVCRMRDIKPYQVDFASKS